jgi:DNA-binding NtrC family response regulator
MRTQTAGPLVPRYTTGICMSKSKVKGQRSIRLLLVDDEKGFADVLAKRLARRNIVTVAAYNGTEGIQKLRHDHFDVAIVDLKMAGLDGIELVKIFKKMDPNLPIIMLTGHGSQWASEEGLKLGVYDYLSKPYELSALMEKIEAAARIQEKRHEYSQAADRRR